MEIPKSPNKLSRIINIPYLPSNNEIYNFFFLKKSALNQSFRVKFPYHISNNQTVENKISHRKNVPCVE